MTIALSAILAKFPIEPIQTTIRNHIWLLLCSLPDKRLGRVAERLILGILGGQTPVITEIAQQSAKDEGETWAVAKSIYRWLENKRFQSSDLFSSLYQIGQQIVTAEQPEYLVVAVDPVNFEKPYAEKIEGVSVVHKATAPALDGKARLTHGYPAITATIVNTKVPVTSYANWFSYITADFISQNKEIEQAFEQTCLLYPNYKIRFVGDSSLDDQKMFAQVANLQEEFFFAFVTWSALLKSITSVWIVGKPKSCKTWCGVCLIRQLSKSYLRMRARNASIQFTLAGSKSVSLVHNGLCGYWWLMTKRCNANWF